MIKDIGYTREQIVRGVKSSDDAVLNYLYRNNYPMIRNLVLSNSGSEADVRETLHQGIIIFFEKCIQPDFELTCEVSTFLYAICRNILLKRIKQTSLNVELTDYHSDLIADEDLREEILELNEQQNKLYRLLETIGESCKKLLKLYYFEKLKFDEIAVKLNYTNADNAKNQKYKCLKKLKVASENRTKV